MGSKSRNSCSRTRGSARDHEQRSQNNRAARSPYRRCMQSDGRARRQTVAGNKGSRAQRRRTSGSSNLACRQASQSWRDHLHARYFRLCRQRAATGVALRANPIRSSSPRYRFADVSHRPCAAGAGARAGLRLRAIRSQDSRSRSMDAFEVRVREEVLSARGKDGSRAAETTTGGKSLWNRASVALKLHILPSNPNH